MSKATNGRVMFHATHGDNLASIMLNGLDPRYATGKRKAVWFVPRTGIDQGILHAAIRHNWRVEELVVLTLVIDSDHIRYSGNSLLFYSEHIEQAENYARAVAYLPEDDDEN